MRSASTEGEAMARPWRGEERDPKSRLDAAATEKKIFRKVYHNLNEWLGRWAADEDSTPIRRNEDRFTVGQSSPIRNIASQLCGVRHETICKYWGEMQASGGALTSAKPTGPGKKHVEDLLIRGIKAGWGGLGTMRLEDEWPTYTPKGWLTLRKTCCIGIQRVQKGRISKERTQCFFGMYLTGPGSATPGGESSLWRSEERRTCYDAAILTSKGGRIGSAGLLSSDSASSWEPPL